MIIEKDLRDLEPQQGDFILTETAIFRWELHTGREAVGKKEDSVFSELQFKWTQTEDTIALAKETGELRNGMGGAETTEEVRAGLNSPNAHAVVLLSNNVMVGGQLFTCDSLSLEMYKTAIRDKREYFPERLSLLTRDHIGNSGTVVIDDRVPGTSIAVPKHQYKISHVVMMQEQRLAGKDMVVSWCFAGNEKALRAHEAYGYQVLRDESGNPIVFKSHYHTLTEEGKNLYLVYCEVNSPQQLALREEILSYLEARRKQYLDFIHGCSDEMLLHKAVQQKAEQIDTEREILNLLRCRTY